MIAIGHNVKFGLDPGLGSLCNVEGTRVIIRECWFLSRVEGLG